MRYLSRLMQEVVNLDGDGTAVDSYSHPQGNVSRLGASAQPRPHPGCGAENRVTAYIHSHSAMGDCTSSPRLIDDVYLFSLSVES